MTENRKISMRQLQILIILSAMGTGVIVLPRRAAEFLPEGAQDGWIIAIGLTVVAMIFGALVSTAARLSQKAAEQSCGATGLSFIQSVSVLLTKPVAYTIGAVMWAKLVFAAGLELRLFLQMTRDVMLPRTPLWVVGAVMLLACAYAAVKGMEARARVGEVLFALMILPFLFMFVVAVMDADFSNLQPIFVNDARSLIYGTLRLGFILTGLECLLLVSPYVPRKKSLTRSVVGALGFAGIIITGITIVTIAKLGRGTDSAAWPVLAMMDAINLPGSFIERQEALMFGFWIITAFVLGNALLFFGGLLVNDVFKKTTLRTGVFLTATAVFFISILPISREAIYARMDYMYLSTGLFFLVILPVCLILVSKITLWGAKAAAKPISFFIFIAFSTVILSGCWDRVEIENRAFVVAMGIDAEDDGYKVTLSVPVFGEKGTEGFPLYGETGENGENGENGETGENGENKQPAFIKTSYGKTLSEALKNLDSKEARHLYYGQTKLLLLGEGILGNSASVESVIATLTNRLKAPGRVHVAAAENAADILSAKPPGEILPGSYVSEIYRDKNKIGGQSFALNFERLKGSVEKSHELCQHRKKIRGFRRFSEVWHMRMDDFSTLPKASLYSPAEEQKTTAAGSAIIPKVKRTSDEIKLSGAVAIKGNTFIGKLSPDELRGLLWGFPSGGKGAVITAVSCTGEKISMTAEKHRVQFEFVKTANPEILRIYADVYVKGKTEDITNAHSRQRAEIAFAKEISKEISATANVLQNTHKIDGYNLPEQLRKKDYALYKKLFADWQNVFEKAEIIPRIIVEV